MIIGALPFMMLGLLMMMSPDYVMPLFTDPRGQIMLLCGLGQHHRRRLRHVADDPVRDLEGGLPHVPVPSRRPRRLGGALGLLLLVGASHWMVEKRARLQRVRTATGKRAGRVVTVGSAKPAKNQQLQQGALAVMRASTKGFSIMKGRQVDETRKLLVSGGFRSRDAIVVFTFFKLVTPLVFLAGAALYVYGMHPLDKGPMVERRGGGRRGAPRQQAAGHVREERAQQAAGEHPQGAARFARHAGDLRRGGARLRRGAEAGGGGDRPQVLGAERGAEPDRARALLHARAASGAGEPGGARADPLDQRLRQHHDPGREVRHAARPRLQGALPRSSAPSGCCAPRRRPAACPRR